MGIKRIVDTSFWTDGKVDDFSPEDKYFMLYLLTNPFSKQLGIYEISIKQAAFQMGYSVDAFNVLLERFENKYKVILFSRETNEVAILNFLRHSVMKGGKPVEDCIRKEMTLVKNKNLIDIVFSRLHGRDDLNETVRKIVDEYIKENDIHNDNDNDNENERTGNDSSTNRQSSDSPESFCYEEIKETILGNKGKGDKVCEWCGCATSILHKHHYPIPKRAGGTATVNICSNCHNEFHLQEGKAESKEVYDSIVSYLNQKAGTNYQAATKKTRACIHARLAEGFTIDDFKAVIDKKCAEWIGGEFEKYLRPETLFGTKFEGYLNAKSNPKEGNGNNGQASRNSGTARKYGNYI